MLTEPLTEQVVNVGYMRHLGSLAIGLFRVPGNKCGQTLNRPGVRQRRWRRDEASGLHHSNQSIQLERDFIKEGQRRFGFVDQSNLTL